MKCAKVWLIVALVQSLASLAQDSPPAIASSNPSASETAILAPARSEKAPASTPTEDMSESYKIGPADILTVTVWKEATLTGSYLVRPDGMITMPLLGDVRASALTPLQLAGDLEATLKKYINNPNVTVQISQIHSKLIYMFGEVAKKGPLDMTPGMTLLQAIASAGGLTDYANAKKIYVLRNDSGKQVKIVAHYKEALKGNSSLNLPLRPGDTIVVP